MALWGNQDSKTASGTVSITTAGAVTGSSTQFTTQAKVGNTIKVGSDEYVIVAIASNTACTVTSGVNGGAIAEKTGQSYTLSEKPAFVAKSEGRTTSGDAGDSTKVFGVDTTEVVQAEARAQGVAHAGWVRRTTGSGGRAGRVFTEVLVAGGSITGDQADDAVFPDRTITITAQPQNQSVEEGQTATFSVTATVSPTNTLTYQWQISTNGDSWSPISGATSASYTTPTTVLADLGKRYRVIVSSTGATSVTSTFAVLTVTEAE
jgi:hypothetical protein